MGNEKSQPADLVIEENAIEVSDRWALHSASYSGAAGGNPKISVFVAPVHTGGQNLLEKFTKNLMVYRHPCILKYVTTWHKGGKLYLATERVKPLAQALPTQTALQVCIGLQSVLKALIFLHDKAESSHNNVCRATVYVTPDGSWKLGGLEYLCRFSELSTGYLGAAKAGRYDAGISTSEQERLPQPASSVDCFAFGVLAEEVLSAYSSGDDVPGMQEFREMCKTQLQNMGCAQRPPLHSLLNLTFFTHEFINIHNFLTELTLKSDLEKQHFFSGLSHKLSMFDEEVVATQLSTLLLSRMVLLDTTAQAHLLPLIFVPRTSPDDVDNVLIGSGGRLFSKKTFRAHLVPKLLPMFCVRDSHVRLILLKHFSSFCNMFSATQLKTHILPELLVGIKDTNDMLVSCTLRALADIVPILGSSVVIGGKSRRKFFADGRPKAAVKMSSGKPEIGSRTNNKTSRQGENDSGVGNEEMCLPERPSPDGGEDLNSPSYLATDEETENWTDWENNAADENTEKEATGANRIDASDEPKADYFKSNEIKTSESQSSNNPAHKENNEDSDSSARSHKNSGVSLPDITQLDIKNSKTNLNGNTKRTAASNPSKNIHNSAANFVKEIDYFQDMEPVIISSNKHIIGDILSTTSGSLSATTMMTTSNSKFEIYDKDLMMNDIEAWGDDVDDNWTVDDFGDNNLSIPNDT